MERNRARYKRVQAKAADEVGATVFTMSTVCFFFGMIGVILGVIVGHLGGRNFSKYIVPTAILILVVLPWVLYTALGQVIMTYNPVDDWGSGAFGWGSVVWLPLIGVIFGGFIGGYSGFQWSEFGERSCLACLMLPVSLLFVLSLVLVVLQAT